MKRVDVVVIGAGITGLTAAFRLKEQGKSVVVLEKENRVGGQIRTVKERGFIYECGPNTGVLSNPEIVELFSDLAPLVELKTADSAAKRRLVWKGRKFHALPSGLFSAVTTPLFKLSDKFRVLAEPLRKKGTNPNESVGELAARRLGQSFVDYAVDPFISGIYAGDPYNLTTRYALPKLYNLEQDYGGFIKGTIAKSRLPKSHRDKLATKDIFSAKGGLQNITDALSQKIGMENIVLLAENVVVSEGFSVVYQLGGQEFAIEADSVVTTSGAYTLSGMLPFVDNLLLEPITKLEYAPVVQVSVGVRRCNNKLPLSFGGLFPSREKKPVLGILFPSDCFPERAPKGGKLYSFFIGGMRSPLMVNCSHDDLKQLALEQMELLMGYDKNLEIDVLHVSTYSHAIPQYRADSKERFEAVAKIEYDYPGLIIAGNLKGGISLSDRVKQGCEIATSLR